MRRACLARLIAALGEGCPGKTTHPRELGRFGIEVAGSGFSGHVFLSNTVAQSIDWPDADRYPEEVAGIVLVDSSHPQQFERMPGNETTLTRINVLSKAGPVLAAVGLVRLSGMFSPDTSDLPAMQRQRIENLIYQTPHLIAAFKEFDALPETMEQAHNSRGLGEKPLAVVSASDHEEEAMADSEAEARRSERAWQVLQKELADLSSNSTHRVIEGSDHLSVLTNQRDAQQTSDEILKVVEAVQSGEPLEQ